MAEMLHLVSEQWFSKDFWGLESKLVAFWLRIFVAMDCLSINHVVIDCGWCKVVFHKQAGQETVVSLIKSSNIMDSLVKQGALRIGNVLVEKWGRTSMTISEIVSFLNSKAFGKRGNLQFEFVSYTFYCMFALQWFVSIAYSGRGMQIQGQT